MPLLDYETPKKKPPHSLWWMFVLLVCICWLLLVSQLITTHRVNQAFLYTLFPLSAGALIVALVLFSTRTR